jgi:hypothetical protein
LLSHSETRQTSCYSHFDAGKEFPRKQIFEKYSKWMLEKGYGFDFSRQQLQKIKMPVMAFQLQAILYQTILLPANKLIPEQSFKKLIGAGKRRSQNFNLQKFPVTVPWIWPALRKKENE